MNESRMLDNTEGTRKYVGVLVRSDLTLEIKGSTFLNGLPFFSKKEMVI
jgi:hypothetical protein